MYAAIYSRVGGINHLPAPQGAGPGGMLLFPIGRALLPAFS